MKGNHTNIFHYKKFTLYIEIVNFRKFRTPVLHFFSKSFGNSSFYFRPFPLSSCMRILTLITHGKINPQGSNILENILSTCLLVIPSSEESLTSLKSNLILSLFACHFNPKNSFPCPQMGIYSLHTIFSPKLIVRF